MAAARHRSVAFLPLLMTALALAVLLTGCGPQRDRGVSPMSEDVNPALHDAAEAVEPELRENFAEVFAGILIDGETNTLVVYRIPDAALEERARELAGAVDIDFRDAIYSLAQMQTVVEQVTADSTFLREEGIAVNGGSPSADGTGVIVYVAESTADVAEQLEERYAPMPIMVEERTIVPPTGPPEDPIVIDASESLD